MEVERLWRWVGCGGDIHNGGGHGGGGYGRGGRHGGGDSDDGGGGGGLVGEYGVGDGVLIEISDIYFRI